MSGKVVVITGASAGLGRAIAHAFAATGARVGLVARNPEALEATRQEVVTRGGEALVLPLDVSDSEAVDAAATKVEEAFGPIEIWVAMLSVFSPVKYMKAAEYKRVTEVTTYLGYVHGTLSALHRMLPRDRGHIIQVGSALAVRSIPLQSAYCACKHAIVGFTDSLRCELIHDNSNVKLSVVQMPAMNTTQFTWVKNRMPNKPQPVPPIFQPEVAAAVVLHAALSPNPRREYFVGSPTVEAIQAKKIVPGILDYYLGKTGYKSQQTDEPKGSDPNDNLWNYVPGKHQAHGPFDSRAHTFSSQVFVDMHRGWFALGAVAILGGVLGAVGLTKKLRAA